MFGEQTFSQLRTGLTCGKTTIWSHSADTAAPAASRAQTETTWKSRWLSWDPVSNKSTPVPADIKQHWTWMRLVQSRSGAVWNSKWPSWAPVPNKSTPVSVDVKQHSTNSTRAAQFREAGASVSPVSRQTVCDVFWTEAENHGELGGRKPDL